MAILYSRSRKEQPTPSAGFDISFKDGTVYDLDRLVEGKDRSNTDSELFIKVINNKELSSKLLSEIMASLSTTISQVISNKEVQDGVSRIISDVASRYGLANMEHIPENIYQILNKEVNEYLVSIFDAYGVNYEVRFFDATRAEITYDFKDMASMRQLTQERLNHFLTDYRNELKDVKEGSFAIVDSGKRKAVGRDDYKAYLLGEEFGQEKSEKGYTQKISGRRPIVSWEEGSLPEPGEDDGEDGVDISAILRELENDVERHSRMLEGGSSNLGKFQMSEVDVGENTSMENDISQDPRCTLKEEHVMLLKD